MRVALIIVARLACGFSLAAMQASAPQAAKTGRTVWDGVYTAAQGERGHAAYVANCGGCHMEDLAGRNAAPALKGDAFMERWREYDLEFLFSMIKTQMPPARSRTSDSARLSDDTYGDILTYILQGNGFPAGRDELKVEMLESVQLIGKDGPKPPPDGSLVLTVGCLTQVSDSAWTLIRATEPMRAKASDKTTPEELRRSEAMPLGTQRFRLVNFDYIAPDFRPNPYSGQQIQVKGFLIRQPNAERINITSLERVAPDCPQ